MQFMCFRPSVFPFQLKNEIMSQSVTAWKAGKALNLSAPRLEALAWAAVYLKYFPVPNVTHSSSTFISSTTEIASKQRQCQQFVLLSSSAAWRNTRMSASSWVHPLIWFRSTSVDDETTLSPQVETSILRQTGVLWIFVERNQNRSLLFSSFFKKLFRVQGNGAKGNTLRRWPWPRLLFVPAFKLSAR